MTEEELRKAAKKLVKHFGNCTPPVTATMLAAYDLDRKPTVQYIPYILEALDNAIEEELHGCK